MNVFKTVVYFDLHLGAVHSKHWSNYAFSMFFVQKAEKGRKSKKIYAKYGTQNCFLSLQQSVGREFYSKKNLVSCSN